jgi:type I restriction enzyme S subunit
MSSEVKIGELIAAAPKWEHSPDLPVYSVTKHRGFVPSLEYFNKQVFSKDLSNYKVMKPGTFAYATIHLDEGSIGVAPVDCLISPMYTAFQVDASRVDPDYFIRFLKSPGTVRRYATLGRGTAERRRAISLDALGSLRINLPPLAEQRRIASTLDEAARLRSMSASSAHEAENLGAAFFGSLFENQARLDGGEVLPLGTVSEVVSGITKGRRTSDPTREVPYLTVANVQDRRLRLGLVKTIEATEREIARYRLRHGDILLTEGGDPDKLGRGAMWNGELDEVIHQNHVFRVRVRDQRLRPEYVSWLMSSARGKKYFASAAKQTTGIASINSTQLKAFPVPIPSTALQNEFAERLDETAKLVARQVDRQARFDELFFSLQHRAFRGEL